MHAVLKLVRCRAAPLRVVNTSRAVVGLPPDPFHGNVTATGGNAAMCALSRSATLSGNGMSRSFPPLGRRRSSAADDADLAADVHHPAQEVDVLDRQPERLALPQPEPGPEVGQRPVPGWQGLPHAPTWAAGHGSTRPAGPAAAYRG